VVEAGQHARLVGEHRDELLLGGQLGADDLERRHLLAPAGFALSAEEHPGHAAATDPAHDLVGANACRVDGRHSGRW